MKEHKKYDVAIYCRLSKDDDIREGESSSIKSQKDIVEQFVKSNGWRVYDYYIDDGYSGVNFKRPAFERMIADIEDGKVNCCITKDLSRLGRNYILAGQYTEMYFPSKGVRFIALNDNVDTINSNENSIAPFVNILNEMYAKDIAKKVRSAVRAKKLKGEFASSHAPYGYQKDPQDKHKLIIEETGAAIVRRIFEMAKADMGSKKICKILNEEGIPTPLNHRKKLLYGIEPKPALWDSGTVNYILRNRIYTGDMVQGVYENSKFGAGMPIRRPKEEWIIVPGTHEPLVDVETFEYAQKMISARNRPVKTNIIQLFAGFVKCEDCNHAMAYSNSQDIPQYTCSTYRRHGRKYCSCHYIRKDVLEQVVLNDIRKYSKLAKDKADELVKQLQAQNGDKDASKIKTLSADLERLNIRNAELDVIMKRLYEDNVSARLSDERFNKFLADYEKEQADVKLKIEDTEETIKEINANQRDTDSWIKLIRNYTKIKELDRTVLSELVDRITIGESREVNGQKTTDVTIYYRFVGAVS
jgi:DNA invertase Pin-like site-specific DNA recombinase